MAHAIVTELEWYPGDKAIDGANRGWHYTLMGGNSGILNCASNGIDCDSSHEEIAEALHAEVHADRITIELGAVPDDD